MKNACYWISRHCIPRGSTSWRCDLVEVCCVKIDSMGNRNRFAPEEFYHLYNRGTERRNIFSDKSDRERFLFLLYLCNSAEQVHTADIFPRGSTSWKSWEILAEFDRGETLVDICTYCLMPNHFHLLVREKTDINTSRFMQKLLTGYTMYFNKKHERTGALFQSKFKSVHADDDVYLKYLISYIHLNPVKLIEPKWKDAGIRNKQSAEKYLHSYPYSSYLDYLGISRHEAMLINKEALPDYFHAPRDFKADVADWLAYKEES